MTKSSQNRPQFRNIALFKDLPAYVRRAPASLFVSLLHRVSGLILVLLLPLLLWILDTSLTSPEGFEQIFGAFTTGRWGIPAWIFKTLLLIPIWSFLHHFFAGIRHVLMDTHHNLASQYASTVTARIVLALSLLLTTTLALKLFNVF